MQDFKEQIKILLLSKEFTNNGWVNKIFFRYEAKINTCVFVSSQMNTLYKIFIKI